MYTKNKTFRRRKQVVPVPFPEDNSLIARNPALLGDLPENYLAIANYYIAFQKKHAHVFPSLAYTAAHFNVHVKTVQRANARLREIGFLGWVHRWNNSNVYVITQWLSNPRVKRAVERFLPALMGMSLALLMCAPIYSSFPEKNRVANYEKKEVFLNSYSSPTSSKSSVLLIDGVAHITPRVTLRDHIISLLTKKGP